MRVPLFDAQAEARRDADELEHAARRVLTSGRYILGPEVVAFEEEVASYLGRETHAVSCASGTDALWLALRALNIGPGDGVIVPAFTFFATASAVLNVGAIPVFCDVDPETLTLDPQGVERIMAQRSPPHARVGVDTASIKAVLPVHLFGQPAEMNALTAAAQRHGLAVIEDAAQAFAARYGAHPAGTLGTLGCFSFFPTKNLGGFGDGGMVVTNDTDLADHLKELRAHGSRRRYIHEAVGTNSRLDALQAALLRVRLMRLDEDIAARQLLADRYDHGLLGDEAIRVPVRAEGRTHTFNVYVVQITEHRDRIATQLANRGIETAIHYPVPLHLQDAVRHLGYQPGDLQVAEDACSRVLSLPLHPSLDPGTVRDIADHVRELAGATM